MSYRDETGEELRELLRDRGLPVSGTKDELVARLEDADGAVPYDDDDDDDDTDDNDGDTASGGSVLAGEEEGQPANKHGRLTNEGYVGVDPIYQNWANETEKPLRSESGLERELEDHLIGQQEDLEKRNARTGVLTFQNDVGAYVADAPEVDPDDRFVSATSKPDEDED